MIVDVCNLGWLFSSLGMAWTFFFQCTWAQECKQRWFVAPQGSWHLGRAPADLQQLCSQVSITRPLQLHPRLERGFCLANCVKPDFKVRGLRLLCARCVPGWFLILRSQLRKKQRADGNWEGLTSLSRLCFLLPWFPFLSDLRVFILSSHS